VTDERTRHEPDHTEALRSGDDRHGGTRPRPARGRLRDRERRRRLGQHDHGEPLPDGPNAARPRPVRQRLPARLGQQRSDETLLTGDALAAVTKAATAKVPGGTIVRVETDADGNAASEAHMTRADGSLVTVYVVMSYAVVSVETR
jgi:hypothetical protein